MTKKKKEKIPKKEETKIKRESNSTKIYVAILIIITFIAFHKLLNASFLIFDDDIYVSENDTIKKGLKWETIKWAFSFDSMKLGFYFPLTILSHLLDVSLFDLNSRYHHLTNIIIHVLNTVLVFYIFRVTTHNNFNSFVIALLFAIHPLHVESVAWIAERKDVLSSFFALLSLLFYAHYAAKKSLTFYLLTFFFYLSGLLSKTMVITLPFVFLLFDLWPLRRISLKRESFLKSLIFSLKEKIPFFLLIPIFSYLTIVAQKKATAFIPFENLPLKLRIMNALISYFTYIIKTFYPTKLTVFYPFNPNELTFPLFLISLIFILLMITATILLLKKLPFFFTGFFIFIGMLVPVIGIFQVGSQARADRYTYLPLLGIFLIITFLFSTISEKSRKIKIFLLPISLIIFSVLLFLTIKQTSIWKDSKTLFEHTLKYTKENWLIDNNYAVVLMDKGELEKAIFHLERAKKVNPNYENIYINLSLIYSNLGKFDEAIKNVKTAITINPNSDKALTNLALALNAKGDYYEAIKCLEKAIKINPKNFEAFLNLGNSYLALKKFDEARKYYQLSAQKESLKFKAYNNIGLSYLQEKKYEEAVHFFKEAINLNPSFLDTHINLGYTLIQLNRLDEAIEELKIALSINPNSTLAKNNLELALNLKKSKINPF